MKKELRILFLIIFCYGCCSAQGDWAWAKTGENANGATGRAITTDVHGNVIVTGNFYKSPIKFESVSLINGKYTTIFIVKYDSSGNVVWGKSFGGGSDDIIHAITTDSNGNILVTGHFSGPSILFDNITLYSTDLSSPVSTAEFFIAKLDPEGNVLWAKSAAGNRYDEGEGIAVDSHGNIYVSGDFQSGTLTFDNITVNITPGFGCFFQSAFIAKYDPGGKIVWVKTLVGSVMGSYGSNTGRGNCITLDLTGHLYITGTTLCPGLTVGNIVLPTGNMFLIKLDVDGNAIWAKSFKGSGFGNYSSSSGVVADAFGKIYITGSYYQTLSIGSTTLSNPSSFGNMSSVFIAKFDAEGNSLWAKSATRGRGIVTDIAANKFGSVFITGYLFLFGLNRDTLDFGDIHLENSIQNISRDNAFVAQYDSTGTALWADFTDSENANAGFGIATDTPGNVLITGRLSYSSNIPFAPGMGPIYFGPIALSQSNPGVFVAKLKPCRHPATLVTHSEAICSGKSINLTSPSATLNHWNTGEVSKSITVKTAGSYRVVISSASGCILRAETTDVSVNSLPKATITQGGLTICEGDKVTLTSCKAESYQWNTGEVTQSISVSKPGLYQITITDANSCTGSATAAEIKTIEPLPEIQLVSDCNRLFVNSNNPVTWYRDDEVIQQQNATQKEYYPLDSGHFHIEIKSICGTKKSNTIFFKPANTQFVSIPNVITPNGDAYNEFFVLDEKLSGSTVDVINRWGETVYRSENYKNNWNGNDLSPGVYFYLIRNSCFTEKLNGTLSIIK